MNRLIEQNYDEINQFYRQHNEKDTVQMLRDTFQLGLHDINSLLKTLRLNESADLFADTLTYDQHIKFEKFFTHLMDRLGKQLL